MKVKDDRSLPLLALPKGTLFWVEWELESGPHRALWRRGTGSIVESIYNEARSDDPWRIIGIYSLCEIMWAETTKFRVLTAEEQRGMEALIKLRPDKLYV